MCISLTFFRNRLHCENNDIFPKIFSRLANTIWVCRAMAIGSLGLYCALFCFPTRFMCSLCVVLVFHDHRWWWFNTRNGYIQQRFQNCGWKRLQRIDATLLWHHTAWLGCQRVRNVDDYSTIILIFTFSLTTFMHSRLVNQFNQIHRFSIFFLITWGIFGVCSSLLTLQAQLVEYLLSN